MRVPFPLAFRIGTDIIATGRILNPLNPDSKRLARLTTRFLHPREFEDLSRRFPYWNTPESQNETQRRLAGAWLAGRWAAKEAAKKAWDATLLSFRDLRVETGPGGRVQIVCDTSLMSDPSSTTRVTEQVAQLSISHDGDYTIATVIATPLHQDISADLVLRKTEAEAKLSHKCL